jgi:hypothetical protein
MHELDTEKLYAITWNEADGEWNCVLDPHTTLVAVRDKKQELIEVLVKLGFTPLTETEKASHGMV